MKASERVLVDDSKDLVVIDGFQIAMPALESLLLRPTREGLWFRITEVNLLTKTIHLEQREFHSIVQPTKETLQ